MTEDFLHYIWKTKQFKHHRLKVSVGDPIRIINHGVHNANAGPDFLDARIEWNHQLWAGPIELHINSSDWKKHHHHRDEAYNNIILHVVYCHDMDINYPGGGLVPTLVLKGLFDELLYWKYEQLLQNTKFIPCENQFNLVDPIFVLFQYDRWIVEGVISKSETVAVIYDETNGDWRETLYRVLAMVFGLSVNAEAFLQLSQLLPLKISEKHRNDLFQMEALLFGVAGYLKERDLDDYHSKLSVEFAFLKVKYGLQCLNKVQWKFSRMHPKGFPTIRIAQFASIIHHSFPEFDELLKSTNHSHMRGIFKIEPSSYWLSHYLFGKESVKLSKLPGEELINRVVINAIIPIQYYYSTIKDDLDLRQRAFQLLSELSSESNRITRRLEKIGFRNESGRDSQALLEMYNNYCRYKKCLNCGIGNQLLKLNHDR